MFEDECVGKGDALERQRGVELAKLIEKNEILC